jgi:hypothetical protein
MKAKSECFVYHHIKIIFSYSEPAAEILFFSFDQIKDLYNFFTLFFVEILFLLNNYLFLCNT